MTTTEFRKSLDLELLPPFTKVPELQIRKNLQLKYFTRKISIKIQKKIYTRKQLPKRCWSNVWLMIASRQGFMRFMNLRKRSILLWNICKEVNCLTELLRKATILKKTDASFWDNFYLGFRTCIRGRLSIGISSQKIWFSKTRSHMTLGLLILGCLNLFRTLISSIREVGHLATWPQKFWPISLTTLKAISLLLELSLIYYLRDVHRFSARILKRLSRKTKMLTFAMIFRKLGSKFPKMPWIYWKICYRKILLRDLTFSNVLNILGSKKTLEMGTFFLCHLRRKDWRKILSRKIW